jgi:hypothetical protein
MSASNFRIRSQATIRLVERAHSVVLSKNSVDALAADFQLLYKPGKELFVADTLSREPSPWVYDKDIIADC